MSDAIWMCTEEDVLAAMRTGFARINMTYDELMTKAAGDCDNLPDEERRVWLAFEGLDSYARKIWT